MSDRAQDPGGSGCRSWSGCRAHERVLLLAVGALGVSTCLDYLISFIPTYSVDTLGLPGYAGFVSAVIAAAGQMVLTPFSGHLSDRVGRLTVVRPVGVVVLVIASAAAPGSAGRRPGQRDELLGRGSG